MANRFPFEAYLEAYRREAEAETKSGHMDWSDALSQLLTTYAQVRQLGIKEKEERKTKQYEDLLRVLQFGGEIPEPTFKTGKTLGLFPYKKRTDIYGELPPETVTGAKSYLQLLNQLTGKPAIAGEPTQPLIGEMGYKIKQLQAQTLYTYDENGNVIPMQGTAGIKASQIKEKPKTLEEKVKEKQALSEAVTKSPEKIRERQENVKTLSQTVQRMKLMIDEIPSGEGITGKLKGAWESGKAMTGYSPQLKTYLDYKDVILGQIVKTIGGETGSRISDQDVKRMQKALPDPMDTTSERQNKWNLFFQIVDDVSGAYGATPISPEITPISKDPLNLFK